MSYDLFQEFYYRVISDTTSELKVSSYEEGLNIIEQLNDRFELLSLKSRLKVITNSSNELVLTCF